MTNNNLQEKAIISRFAPSPTGSPHLGSVISFLLPYCFVRQSKGKIIFRVDDTDIERSQDCYLKEIQDGLKFLNIDYDITFKQSSRLDRYNQIFTLLKEHDYIYPCQHNDATYDLIRSQKQKNKQAPIITREDQNNSIIEENDNLHWRFDLNGLNSKIEFKDLVFGCQAYKNNLSDPIVKKKDGSFTYNFCSVVDDIDYNVSYIIRGSEHLINTLPQVAMGNTICQILQQSKWNVKFLHYPLFLDNDRKKLSKRNNAINLSNFIDLEPQSIWSFLLACGGQPIISLNYQDYIDNFNFNVINTTPKIVNIDSLYNINRKILQQLTQQEVERRGGNWALWTLGCRFNNWREFKNMSDKFQHAYLTPEYTEIKRLLSSGKDNLSIFKKHKNFILQCYKAWLGCSFGPKIIDLIQLIDRTQQNVISN